MIAIDMAAHGGHDMRRLSFYDRLFEIPCYIGGEIMSGCRSKNIDAKGARHR